MTGINEYKPMDNGDGTGDDWGDQGYPMASAIGQRLINNGQFTLQNRLRRQSKSWDATVTSDTSLTTFANSAGDGSKIVGYTGDFSGSSDFDTATIGFEFSTHPSIPLAIPFGWRTSAGARKIRVNICLEVQNATGSMYAYSVASNGVISPREVEADKGPVSTFGPAVAPGRTLDFFTDDIRDQTSYALMGPTTLSGTNSLSYYTASIDLGRSTGDGFSAYNTQDSVIFLCFQSGYDPAADASPSVGSTAPVLTTGNRVLRTNGNMAKYGGLTNPGKYHRLAHFTYSDATVEETWHQVLQLRPYDATIDPFDSANPETFVLYPAIPPAGVPPSLVGGSSDFGMASEGTGLLAGDSFDLHKLCVFKIHSVSFEEEF